MPSSILNSDDGVVSGTSGLKSSGGDDGTLAVQSNGTELAKFKTTELVINDGGDNYDFRVEGDTNANLLVADASADAVGIGVSTPAAILNVDVGAPGGADKTLGIFQSETSRRIGFVWDDSASTLGIATLTNNAIAFHTNGNSSERMRIDTSGNLLVGRTAVNGSERLSVEKDATNQEIIRAFNTASSSPWGMAMFYLNANPNNTGSSFYAAYSDTTSILRFAVRSNGGIANYSANNANLSDRREKTNFSPAKNYLETICAIPVQTFNYIDQNLEDDPGLTLGVVAQDVQEVAPEFVMESNWGTQEEPKMRLSIYQTDLQYALMKCVQELKAELDTVKAELATLKGQA